jgi:peptidoglycan hydrolase-like protein with peptidoglycan-binding domain
MALARPGLWWQVLQWVGQRRMDSLAALIAAVGTGIILVNALFLQTGRHPAPIFANRLPPAAAAPAAVQRSSAPPANASEPMMKPRPRASVIADIQRELTRRGFYDGPADGVYGPRTDAAIRDFEQAARMRPSAEPNDALLSNIAQSTVKAKPAATPAARKADPIAELLDGPGQRVIAVQRALADFGYGQVKPSGVYDRDTKAAIERFERENRLPITGQITDRLTRQITTMTGRPLE